MIQTVVFIVIPLLLCCLSLALGIQCAFLGVSVLAAVLLLAAGALAGLSCFRGMEIGRASCRERVFGLV